MNKRQVQTEASRSQDTAQPGSQAFRTSKWAGCPPRVGWGLVGQVGRAQGDQHSTTVAKTPCQ